MKRLHDIINLMTKIALFIVIIIPIIMIMSSCDTEGTANKLRTECSELRHDIDSLDKCVKYKKSQIKSLNEEIKEKTIIKSGKQPQYIITIRIKQSTFTLDIGEHIKNEINSINMDIPVSKDFYNAVKVNQEISSDFKYGSLIMDGDFSTLNVKVINKKIT